jgi:phage repressor protein C with HTH and peptisase S24 domain
MEISQDSKEIIARFKEIKKLKTDTELAEFLGIKQNTISTWKSRNTIDLSKIIEECNVRESMYVLYGEDITELENIAYRDTVNEADEKNIKNDFVTIPLMSGRISAGTGLLAQEGADTCMCFRKEWINKKGDPKNMSLIMVSGDSMQPTLSNGDVVLIDHSRNYIHDYGIYAICVDDSILIKRLQPFGNKVQIISDNSKYPPLVLDAADVVINGKALWYAHDLSD